MKGQHLLRAMSFVDDEWVWKAHIRQNEKKKRRTIFAVCSLAAAVILACALLVSALMRGRLEDDQWTPIRDAWEPELPTDSVLGFDNYFTVWDENGELCYEYWYNTKSPTSDYKTVLIERNQANGEVRMLLEDGEKEFGPTILMKDDMIYLSEVAESEMTIYGLSISEGELSAIFTLKFEDTDRLPMQPEMWRVQHGMLCGIAGNKIIYIGGLVLESQTYAYDIEDGTNVKLGPAGMNPVFAQRAPVYCRDPEMIFLCDVRTENVPVKLIGVFMEDGSEVLISENANYGFVKNGDLYYCEEINKGLRLNRFDPDTGKKQTIWKLDKLDDGSEINLNGVPLLVSGENKETVTDFQGRALKIPIDTEAEISSVFFRFHGDYYSLSYVDGEGQFGIYHLDFEEGTCEAVKTLYEEELCGVKSGMVSLRVNVLKLENGEEAVEIRWNQMDMENWDLNYGSMLFKEWE